MTDEEILKAFECCCGDDVNGTHCKDCPAEKYNFDWCSDEVSRQMVDYTKRLQAENAALRERSERSVDKEQIAKLLAGMFGCPCDYFPLDEEMYEYCDDCGMDNVVCWEKVIDKKSARLAELKGEKE